MFPYPPVRPSYRKRLGDFEAVRTVRQGIVSITDTGTGVNSAMMHYVVCVYGWDVHPTPPDLLGSVSEYVVDLIELVVRTSRGRERMISPTT